MMIKTFFKYRPINNIEQLKFVLDIIENNRFYLSPIYHFSDPFDSLQRNKTENSDLRILSLTQNGNNRLMWSYYAFWYRGIMLEFRFNIMNYPFNNLKKIKYSDSEFELIKSLNNNNFYIKSCDFKHEQEWRAIYKGLEYLEFSKNEIISATIGPSLNINCRSKLLNSLVKLDIPVYEYNNKNGVPDLKDRRLLT